MSKLLFIGDIVGRPGRDLIKQGLAAIVDHHNVDLVIANAENAAAGFGITRELELHEEAGFRPLEVIKHATSDGAKIVGLSDKLGRIREGFIADLLVVNGNPVENLRVLNPYGIDVMTYDGKVVNNYSGFVQPGDPHVKLAHGGGIEWTIKDGIPYYVPTLMKEVKDMVAKARAQRK